MSGSSPEPILARLRERLDQARDALARFRLWTRKAPGNALRWARRHWVTLWLAPQAAVSVLLFFHGAGTLQSATGRVQIGVIDGDLGVRRERGDFAFKAAFAGEEERDWEGLASSAEGPVPFRVAGTSYILDPSSVIVFRAPFRDSRVLEDRFRILKGRVTTRDHREIKQGHMQNQVQEIPKLTADLTHTIRAKIYPRIDSHLVVGKPGQASIAFSWSRPQTGFIALLSVESDQVRYIPIEGVDHVHAKIDTDRSYAWQIVSPDRRVLEGPFRFQIASGGIEAWKRVLTDPSIRKDKGGVDVLLDE